MAKIDRLNVDPSKIPPRCGIHQIVKGSAKSTTDKWRACLFCRYYTRTLKATRCRECLETENLDNFKVDVFVDQSPWYRAKERKKDKDERNDT